MEKISYLYTVFGNKYDVYHAKIRKSHIIRVIYVLTISTSEKLSKIPKFTSTNIGIFRVEFFVFGTPRAILRDDKMPRKSVDISVRTVTSSRRDCIFFSPVWQVQYSQ